MIKISLTEQEMIELKKLRLNRHSNVGEHAHYVLLAAQGKSAPAIAKQLNRNIITVRLWLHRYQAEGISGLKSRSLPGRPAKKALIIAAKIEELLSKSPKAYGYQESGWQVNLLRDWFAGQGCKACHNTIVKILNEKGFVYKRFSKTTPTHAPSPQEKQKVISNMVETIKGYSKQETEIFFEDESHFSNQPYVSRGWFKKGEKKQ